MHKKNKVPHNSRAPKKIHTTSILKYFMETKDAPARAKDEGVVASTFSS